MNKIYLISNIEDTILYFLIYLFCCIYECLHNENDIFRKESFEETTERKEKEESREE